MNEFEFEIFLRGVDRYAWRLVEHDGDRRVLARSLSDFPTPLRARTSILVMKQIVESAPIVTADGGFGEEVAFEIVDAFPLRLSGTVSRRDAEEMPATALQPAAASQARQQPAAQQTGTRQTGTRQAAAQPTATTGPDETAVSEVEPHETDETTGARTGRDGPHTSAGKARKTTARKTAGTARAKPN